MHVCVCVYMREGEIAWAGVAVCVCVCVCRRNCVGGCDSMCVCVREKEGAGAEAVTWTASQRESAGGRRASPAPRSQTQTVRNTDDGTTHRRFHFTQSLSEAITSRCVFGSSVRL